MTVLQLARSELKRMTSGILPRLSIIALTLVPLLYGAVYLYANWDPYSNLDKMDAALVVEDEQVKTADDSVIDAGDKVASNLEDSGTFNWIRVDSKEQAEQGVASGKYAFALMIPKDFSAALASPADFDASRQAILSVSTNDANNYILSNIVDKLTTEVHQLVAQEVGEETANKLLTGFGQIHSKLVQAAEGADQLAGGISTAREGAGRLDAGLGELATGAQGMVDAQRKLREGSNKLAVGTSELEGGLNQIAQGTSTLPEKTRALADGAEQVAAANQQFNSKLQQGVQALNQAEKSARDAFSARLEDWVQQGIITGGQADQMLADYDAATQSSGVKEAKDRIRGAASDVQKLSDGSSQVAAGNRQLANAMPDLAQGVSSAGEGATALNSGTLQLAAGQQQALEGAEKLRDGADTAHEGSSQLSEGMLKLDDGAQELADQLRQGAGTVPNPSDSEREKAAKVMSNPVDVNTVSQTKADNYGAGLAPFFMALSLWIGIFMLVQILRPISKRALASNARSWRIALGGWLPFLGISLVQATLLYAVVYFFLGLEIAYPWLTWGLMLLAAFAFTAIIQATVAMLGQVGKFLVLIMMILQLVASGGTFPWQTAPEPLAFIHQFLPLSYVVTGMRQLIYGGELSLVLPVVLALVSYTVLGLGLGTLAAQRHKMWTVKTLKPEVA